MASNFQEGIDSEALAALDDSQLKELGVKRMGDRTKVACQFSLSLFSSRHSLFLAQSSPDIPFSSSIILLAHAASRKAPHVSFLSNVPSCKQLRAKATGIALPAPFASSPPRAGQPDNGMRGQGGGGGQNVPEHLKVLNRISAASPPAKLRVRSTVDDLAEKISATNFVLAGGSLHHQVNY